jgi:rhodanese-related sulfurtransferase
VREFGRILLEAAIVAVAGALVGVVGYFIARPIDDIRRDFSSLTMQSVRPMARPTQVAPTTRPATTGPATTEPATDRPGDSVPPAVAAANPVEQRLLEAGLGVIHFDEVLAAYHDPAYAAGMIVFVDARVDRHYEAGHIPGAYQYDYFKSAQPPPELQAVLLSPDTQKVIVYCGGGQCEDSEHAAIILAQNGVPPGNIFVYLGGWKEWVARGQPAATGADRGTPGGQ